MSININIIKAVDCYLTTKAKGNDRDFSYFHASSWDNCHRQTAYAYYEAKGIITINDLAIKISPQLERIFDNGHYLHYRYGSYLEKACKNALWGQWKCLNLSGHSKPMVYGLDSKLGCPKPDQCECGCTEFQYVEIGFRDEELWWGGHVDGIIDITKWANADLGEYTAENIPREERFFVIDFKSMNPFSFKDLKKPKPEHLTQMQIYLYLSGLKYGKFLYENKGDQSVKEYLVEKDDAVIAIKREEAVILKHRLTHTNSVGKHVLPPRGYDSKGCTTCLQCKYRGHCWT